MPICETGKNDNGPAAAAATVTAVAKRIIETPTGKLVDITPLQWVQDLRTRHQTLLDTIENSTQPLSQLRLPLEFALSVKNVLNIADCTLPFAGFLLGVPSSLKT